MYFSHILTSSRCSLYLPKDAREDIFRLVSAHRQTKTTRQMAPFRRQADFWLLCIGVALAGGLPPLEGSPNPPKGWGYKFNDTRDVQLPTEVYNLLSVVAFEALNHDPDRISDPVQIINVANGLAGAACDQVLEKLTSKDLRLTPLDKALELARSTYNS